MSFFNFKKIKQEYHHILSATEIAIVNQPKSLFTPGVGLRCGKQMMEGLIDKANQIWGSQSPEDMGSINTVVIITMGRNEDESLVTMVFNPGTECNDNNLPELEAEAYMKATEYLQGACINRGGDDKRIALALERMRKVQSEGKSSLN